MVIHENCGFDAVNLADFPVCRSISEFQSSPLASFVLEPDGRMTMPPVVVTNSEFEDYSVHTSTMPVGSKKFPSSLPYPPMMVAIAENAYCQPFGAPFLPSSRQLIAEYLIPWAPSHVHWFSHAGDKAYSIQKSLDTSVVEHDIDYAFYLDHPISKHFGHFIGDCLCRMHAWDICRDLFPDLKVIISSESQADYQTSLLNAAGVYSRDIVRATGLLRCKRMLFATQSLGVEQYASPTSVRLWDSIRGQSAVRDPVLPDRIYLSRSDVKDRKLQNEVDVESIFSRHGFVIVHPETLSITTQIALISNARFVAGPSGSGMFNLAFQARMRSVFILVWENFIHQSELLFSAGHECELWFHRGQSAPPEASGGAWGSWVIDLARLESDVSDWLSHCSAPKR